MCLVISYILLIWDMIITKLFSRWLCQSVLLLWNNNQWLLVVITIKGSYIPCISSLHKVYLHPSREWYHFYYLKQKSKAEAEGNKSDIVEGVYWLLFQYAKHNQLPVIKPSTSTSSYAWYDWLFHEIFFNFSHSRLVIIVKHHT